MINRPTTILFLAIIVLAVGGYWLIWPAYNQIGQTKTELQDWQKRVDDAKQTEIKIQVLAKKYENPENTERLFLALPQEEDQPGLLVQMENLAATNGLILNSIDFLKEEKQNSSSPNPAAGANAAPDKNSDIKKVPLGLKLSGEVNSFRNFLRAVENNLRIMDIRAASFDVIGSGTGQLGGGVNFSVTLDTYYRNK